MPIYRFQSEESALRLNNMSLEDYKVYDKIEESTNRGITAIDIKNKLQAHGFTQVTVSQILKKLEKDGSIKKLKSLEQKNRQVFMLFDVIPSPEVTGGLVNTDQFDPE